MFPANRQEVLPHHPGFPVLPQCGNVCAVLGLVVALHEQLGETDNQKTH